MRWAKFLANVSLHFYLAFCLLLACGGNGTRSTEFVPQRSTTAGDALLSSVPTGADLLLEIDLARLRNNAVVGTILASVAAPEAIAEEHLLRDANTMLVCVYGVGDGAKQLIVLQAHSGVELNQAAAIGGGRYAVGDPSLVSRAVALGGGSGESMLEDEEFLRLRSSVMPAEAKWAAVRAVARLDFDARVAVASKVHMSEVPVSLALWGDVVDDLAIVVHVVGEEAASHERLHHAMLSLRSRIAKKPYVRFLGLTTPLGNARITRSDSRVQLVFVLSPKRLALLAERLMRQLQQPTESHD